MSSRKTWRASPGLRTRCLSSIATAAACCEEGPHAVSISFLQADVVPLGGPGISVDDGPGCTHHAELQLDSHCLCGPVVSFSTTLKPVQELCPGCGAIILSGSQSGDSFSMIIVILTLGGGLM